MEDGQEEGRSRALRLWPNDRVEGRGILVLGPRRLPGMRRLCYCEGGRRWIVGSCDYLLSGDGEGGVRKKNITTII